MQAQQNADTTAVCPFPHHLLNQQKTAKEPDYGAPAIERDAEGTWHIRNFEGMRSILRSGDTRQAGFNADLITRIPNMTNTPILYLEGQAHHQQRRQTARFFAPKVVSDKYYQVMEKLVDEIIAELQQKRSADLSQLSMKLAVRVAAEVVGLTNSRLPGMAKRLEAFFGSEPLTFNWTPRVLLSFLRNQTRMAAFYYLDVQPAIKARKRKAQEDVISHLVAQNYSQVEILTECVTYAAAGMATTREFISVATWHLLEQPALRQRYMEASEKERHAILEEILRVEPVVGHLFRRATAEITLEHEGTSYTIPQDALIDLHIYNANTDEAMVGDHPLAICPVRELHGERLSPAMMSFGDGGHRCPGSYIAIQETDVLLQRLFSLDTLHIVHAPNVSWHAMIKGYELRQFTIAL
ncbi:cytochrome P450, putative [Ktedonobacter sp. SOSP1-85]|uniref:cytochrome P450 n=1 Tax=Ktedonobacter sp. SOSP1-85 TaxID=2778367 RepID=UPI001915A29E|nr:cytochrome P450 [Ktedonobacter sp. SOSP1-85]GHO78824.1 cytochrome P450, putative [Ktedonobacter sp. SOSP1-85]